MPTLGENSYMSCLWKQSPDEMFHQNFFFKNKHLMFFWFQVGDINIPDIFYRTQNFIWWPVFLVITHWTFTWLSPWALQKLYQTTGCPFLTGTPLNSLSTNCSHWPSSFRICNKKFQCFPFYLVVWLWRPWKGPIYPASLYTVLHCTVYTIRRSTLNKIHFSLPYKEYNVHCTHTVHNAQYTL